MPIKTDGAGKRWVEMEVLVPGTPEQVWQAMATGDGNGAWFTRTTIEERAGGALRFDFGKDMTTSGEVTIWEPPRRFGYVEREWAEGAPPVATEITITGRSGNQCVVRMVHSLFTSSDDWDDQMESFETGWPGFFEILRIYLRHFAGQKAASVRVMGRTGGDQRTVWSRLLDDLGLAGVNVGERRTTPARPEVLSGVVERIAQDDLQRYAILRLDAPSAGVALVGTYGRGAQVNVNVIIYLYGDDATKRAEASEHLWQAWVDETYPSGA
jgi:uncharacterized protein YndB with AHSA1/START domain